jgi:hypothetical protein
MPHDTVQTGLGFELTSLRALGEERRRRSLADRLLRERRDAESLRVVRLEQRLAPALSLSPSPAEP